jgi:hypothetical protein
MNRRCIALAAVVMAAMVAARAGEKGPTVAEQEASVAVTALAEQNAKLRAEAEALRGEVKSLTVTLAETVAELDLARAQAGRPVEPVAAAAGNGALGEAGLVVLDVNRPLNMVVLAAGAAAGVKPGMQFAVMRDERLVARVRASDVRDAIAGAVVEELEKDDFPEKGDRVIIWREKSGE